MDTLTGWKLSLQAQSKAPSTVSHYLRDAARFLQSAGKPVDSLTGADVREYLRQFGEGRSVKTLKEATLAIRLFLRFLYAEGDIPSDIAVKLRLPSHVPEPQPAYTPEQVKALLAVCNRRTKEGSRDYAIIALLFDNGLRRAELTSMHKLDFDNGLFWVRGKRVRGKPTTRPVPMGVMTAQALHNYIRRWAVTPPEDLSSPLWRSAKGGYALTPNGVYQLVKRLCRDAGVACLGVHAFRRSAAIAARSSGQGECDILENFGWTGITMLRHYTGVMAQALAQKAHKAHSPADILLGVSPTTRSA